MRTVASTSCRKPRRMRSSSRLGTASMRAAISSRSASCSPSTTGAAGSPKRAWKSATISAAVVRVVDQHLALVGLGELAPHHLAVAAVGAQDLHVGPGHGRAADEPVQEVGLRVTAQDRADGVLDHRAQVLEVELRAVEQHAEVVQVGAVVRQSLEAGRHLLDDGQPEALEDRQERRQLHLAAELGDDEARQRLGALVRVVGAPRSAGRPRTPRRRGRARAGARAASRGPGCVAVL